MCATLDALELVPRSRLQEKKWNKFIALAEKSDLEVYAYSGRGMFGSYCPAVNVDYMTDLNGNTRGCESDNMGMGYVIYCR